ncbi:hypothetical protein DFH94DRAFT_622818, partial [Russula ochroleuca]
LFIEQQSTRFSSFRALRSATQSPSITAAHLIPVFGSSFVPGELCYSDSLDVYHAYFVNNYIDHHSHKFLS